MELQQMQAAETVSEWVESSKRRPAKLAPLLHKFGTTVGATLMSCLFSTSGYTVDFPATNDTKVTAQKLRLSPNAQLRDFAIAPDRTQLFVLSRMQDASGVARSNLSVYDANGALVREVALSRPNDATTIDELVFTDQGELIWDDTRFFHFVDAKELTVRAFPQCRATAHPLLNTHRDQAKAKASVWRDAELELLYARFGLKSTEVVVGNPKVPAEFWPAYRNVNATAEMKVESYVEEAYNQMIEGFAELSLPLTGVKLLGNYDNAARDYVRRSYVRIVAEGNTWYCELKPTFERLPVTWSSISLVRGSKSKLAQAPLTVEKDDLRDGDVRLSVVRRNKTSTYLQDLVGLMKTDTVMELTVPGVKYLFTVKDRPVRIARNHAIRLSNGNVAVRYLGDVYIFPVSGM